MGFSLLDIWFEDFKSFGFNFLTLGGIEDATSLLGINLVENEIFIDFCFFMFSITRE